MISKYLLKIFLVPQTRLFNERRKKKQLESNILNGLSISEMTGLFSGLELGLGAEQHNASELRQAKELSLPDFLQP